MAAEFFFAVKTIGLSRVGGRKPCTLLQAARHNLREIQAELGADGHIDGSRSADNIILAGPATAAEVVTAAEQVAAAAGIDTRKLRRDHVQALELVFSIPPGHTLDAIAYFQRCLAWTRQCFKRVAMLSVVSHADESTDHVHVLLAPIQDGQHVGGRLIERARLAQLRERFWQELAGPAGFKRSGARLHGQVKRWAIDAVLARLQRDQDSALESALWPLIRRAVEDNPLPHLEALGIDPNSLRPTDKAALPKPIGIEKGAPKPVGIAGNPIAEQSLSCVGFVHPEPRAAPQRHRLQLASRAEQFALERQARRQPPQEEWSPQIIECEGGVTRERVVDNYWPGHAGHEV